MEFSPASFCQPWLHSHEEDSGGTVVYRPASFPFPPSRGRRQLIPLGDGRLVGHVPGPDDRPSDQVGAWEFHDGVLTISGPSGTQRWSMVALQHDRLVLRRIGEP